MSARPLLTAAGLFAALCAAFYLGRGSVPEIDAQGVGTNKPTLPPIGPRTLEPESGAADDVAVYELDGGGMSASANGVIAVTGSYGVGTSVLYVIDTKTKQLALYEGRGGSKSMRRLVLVGARRIDLDLQLRGYNDESEYSYAALERMFDARRRPDQPTESVRRIEASVEPR